MQLDPTAAAAGVRLITHETVGSTNEEALKLGRAGERAPLWIVARRQTAGRGRRGRTWVSEPGNLYASLLLTDPSPPDRFPELAFVAALALHDAVTGRIPGLAGRVALKWPNDLLIDRNKFAGILVEGEMLGGKIPVMKQLAAGKFQWLMRLWRCRSVALLEGPCQDRRRMRGI